MSQISEYYVYRWFFKSTNQTFYVGKGKGNRVLSLQHRNQFFLNILHKHADDVDHEIMYHNLTEEESFEIESLAIAYFWSIGQCKANFHEGGCGGNTGNYDSKERSRKISEFAKKRVGKLNPMYGKTHTEAVRKYLSEINKGKKLTEEHRQKLIKSNTGRKKTEAEIERIRSLRKGVRLSEDEYLKMMNWDCPYLYKVYLNGKQIFECLGHTRLFRYCSEKLGASKTIIEKVMNKGDWEPKFKRHMHLKTLIVEKIDRGVTTNGDECNRVGGRLAPVEVRSNQDMVDEIVCPNGNIG